MPSISSSVQTLRTAFFYLSWTRHPLKTRFQQLSLQRWFIRESGLTKPSCTFWPKTPHCSWYLRLSPVVVTAASIPELEVSKQVLSCALPDGRKGFTAVFDRGRSRWQRPSVFQMGNGLLGMDESGGFTAATDPRVCFTEKKIGGWTNFWLAQLISTVKQGLTAITGLLTAHDLHLPDSAYSCCVTLTRV